MFQVYVSKHVALFTSKNRAFSISPAANPQVVNFGEIVVGCFIFCIVFFIGVAFNGSGFADYDGKGILLRNYGHDREVRLTWSAVDKRAVEVESMYICLLHVVRVCISV